MMLRLLLIVAALFTASEGAKPSKKRKDNQKVVPSPTKAPVIDNPQEFRSLNIVITNDDGFETDLIQSLFFGLQNAGHSVIMSAPYSGQSGTSGLIDFLRPILPTSADSPKKTIKAGAPGVGPTTLADMQYYVNGAVTGAVLNGIDVLAPKFFAGPVDLVISGPNEGNNVGLLTPHSGTVAAAITAMNRGIPGIAVSADTSEKNPDLVADIVVDLVSKLIRRNGLALPSQNGLNVNVANTKGFTSVADFEYRQTKIGLAGSVGLLFVNNLGDSCPIAAAYGLPKLPYSGMCLASPFTAAGYPSICSCGKGDLWN